MALALTTKEKVKQMLALTGTSKDPLIDDLILEVSDEAETYLRRWTKSERRTEIYELGVNDRYLSLDGFPILGSVGVQYAPTRDFSGIDSFDTSAFAVINDAGQLDFFGLTTWFEPVGFVQVIYQGGMATDTAGFIVAYPRIAGVVTREVVNRLNRSKTPEGNVQGAAGMQLVYQKELQPLKDFYAGLDHHRRIKL